MTANQWPKPAPTMAQKDAQAAAAIDRLQFNDKDKAEYDALRRRLHNRWASYDAPAPVEAVNALKAARAKLGAAIAEYIDIIGRELYKTNPLESAATGADGAIRAAIEQETAAFLTEYWSGRELALMNYQRKQARGD